MPIVYRDAKPESGDAIGVLGVYREAEMIILDEDIALGTQEEAVFWQEWVQRWAWRLAEPTQHFFVAIDEETNEIVGVARGGILYHQTTGACQSNLDLRQKEVDCVNATSADEVVQYGLVEEGEDELGPIVNKFNAEVNGLFVKKAYQNMGIGSKLLSMLMQSLASPDPSSGMTKVAFGSNRGSIAVWTWIDNVDAIRFYERNGWTRVGCRKREKAIVRFSSP